MSNFFRQAIRSLRPWLGVVGICAVAVIIHGLVVLHAPFEFEDEGYLYAVARHINWGRTLYTGVELHSYLPGPFLLFAALFEYFGFSLPLARFLCAFFLVLTSIGAYFFLRVHLSSRWATVCTLVLILVPGPFYKFYPRMIQLLLLASALYYFQILSRRRALLLGATVGLSMWVRVDAFYVGIAFLLCIPLVSMWARRISLRSALVSCSWSVAPVLCAFALTFELLSPDAFGRWCAQFVDVLHIAAERNESDLTPGPFSLGHLFELTPQSAFAWAFYSTLAVLPLGFLALAFAWRLRAQSDTWIRLSMIWGWLILNMPQYLFVRADAYHVSQQFFAIVVATGFFGHSILKSCPQTLPRRVVFLLTFSSLATLPAQQFLAGNPWSTGVLLLSPKTIELSNGHRFLSAPNDEFEAILEIILRGTEAQDFVFALPFLPGVSALGDRMMAPPQMYFLPVNLGGKGDAVSALIDELETKKPKIVVYSLRSSTNDADSGVLIAWAPRLHHYLVREYLPLSERGGKLILVREGEDVRPGVSLSALLGAQKKYLENNDYLEAAILTAKAVQYGARDSRTKEMVEALSLYENNPFVLWLLEQHRRAQALER